MNKIIVIVLLISSAKSIAQNNFVYQNNDEKVSLKIENGNDFIIKNQSNPIVIQLENIDSKSMSLSGIGIHFSKKSMEESITEKELFMDIDLTEKKIKKTFLLHFSYKKNGEFYNGTFEIPIKKP